MIRVEFRHVQTRFFWNSPLPSIEGLKVISDVALDGLFVSMQGAALASYA